MNKKPESVTNTPSERPMPNLRKRVTELAACNREQRRAIREWREGQLLYKTMYVESPVAIELCDARGRYVDMNQACLEMFGLSDIADQKWPAVLEDPIVPLSVRNSLKQGNSARYRISVDFDQLRNDHAYRGTRSGTAYFDVLAKPLRIKVGQSSTGYLLITQETTGLTKAEQRLRDYQKQLRSLASELSLSEERERRRLAADLHDELGQTLAVIKIKLGAIRRGGQSPVAGQQMEDVLLLLEKAIRHTRALTFELSPPILQELGLEPALDWLAEQFQEQHGIHAEFKDDGQPKPLEADVRGLLFQAVRELLMNVLKHSKATRVTISVRRCENNAEVQVCDDGTGFGEKKTLRKTKGFGLFNLKERLAAIGGYLTIHSRPGAGTSVTMVAPLRQRPGTP